MQVQEPELAPQLPHIRPCTRCISHSLVTLLTVLIWSLLGTGTCVYKSQGKGNGGRRSSGAPWPASLPALERSRPVADRSHKTKNDSQGCILAPTDLPIPTPSHHLAAPPTYAPAHVHTCKNGLEKYKDNTHFTWKTQKRKWEWRERRGKLFNVQSHTVLHH